MADSAVHWWEIASFQMVVTLFDPGDLTAFDSPPYKDYYFQKASAFTPDGEEVRLLRRVDPDTIYAREGG